MDSHTKTNRAVAEALGWEIVPQENAYGEHELVAYTADGKCYVPWRPSTDPTDALAALEAWCKANDACAELYFNLSDVAFRWECHIGDLHSQKPDFCHSVCTAIILAAEAARG